MTQEEIKLVKSIQRQFILTYLCKPPTELLKAIVWLHRLNKALERAIGNIVIQLKTPNSNLNIQLENQIQMMNNRMMR